MMLADVFRRSGRYACPALIAAALIALPASAQDTTPVQAPGAAVEAPAPQAPNEAPATPPTDATAAELPPGAPDISSELVVLRVVGPWSAEGQNGFSRLLAMASDGKLTLYVQWITDDGTIIRTVEVDGDEEPPQLALSNMRVEAGQDNSALYFDTPEDAQGFRETYVLIVGLPGDARFGPATN